MVFAIFLIRLVILVNFLDYATTRQPRSAGHPAIFQNFDNYHNLSLLVMALAWLRMHWKIITVGKLTFPWAKEAFNEYLSRLQRVTRVEHVIIKEGPLELVENQILQASADSLRVVLDERGKARRSVEVAAWIKEQDLSSRKRASLIIGGANGHSPALRKSADECWTLSSFTLQHEIALIVMAEQLYRAYTILKNEPYHRE